MNLDFFDAFDDSKPIEYQPWMESGEFNFILVTPDNIADCIDACINAKNGRFALDLETTGIDNRVDDATKTTKDKIVGVCLSGDGKTGWYIPLRHQKGTEHNLPWSLFDREFRRLMDAVDNDQVVAVFHNSKFDQEFLEFHGGEPYGQWDPPKRWEDTLILAYLRNSRARRKSLKALSEAPPDANHEHPTGGPGLGMKMLELKDLFPPKHPEHLYDFSLLDPSEKGPRIYGCSDAICTWLLCDLLFPVVIQPSHGFSQEQIYRVEKGNVIACRWMERNRIPTSPKIVMELIQLGQQEWFDSIMVVYEAANEILGRDVMPGYYKVLKYNRAGADEGGFVPNDPLNLLPEQVTRAKAFESRYFPNPLGTAEKNGQTWPLIYDVNAPVQLGRMFDEMGVPGLVRTEKSGQVKTSKDVLEAVIEQAADRFPFMQKIRRFRETNKALSSYLFPMLEDVDPNDFTMRINFNPHKVDTGRFSTPAKERELASAKTKRIPGWPEINLQSMPATYDPRRPACMTRLRECIVARPGFFIVAIDFSGEELRLVTNLSREPLWLEEFFRCSGCGRKFPRGDGSYTPEPPPPRCPNCGSDKIGDLHTLTALSIYGNDAINKAEWKQLRGNAKGVNFALCYGGGGGAVVRACSVDKNEGWRIKNQFDGTYTGLKNWWTGQHRFANEHGFVLTAFGRVYPVPDIWSGDGGFRSKAERNSVNGPIQGCLHGDSRVPTSLGIRRIEDISGQTFDVWTGTRWSRGRAFPSGQKRLVHTTLSSGLVMRTSPDHRFRVYENGVLTWVRQEDLTPDTWVVTDAVGADLPEQRLTFADDGGSVHNKKGYHFEGNNEALWELLGLVIGDGSIRDDGVIIHVGGPDAAAQARFYADRFASALNLSPTMGVKFRSEGDERLPIWQVCFWNTAFREFCRTLGLGDWNTYTKRVPEAVWSQSSRHRAAFLRGYFSADGCVNVADAVDVRSTNNELLMETHKLLRSIGIRSTVRLDSKRVSIKDRAAFRDRVGSLVSTKSDRLAAIESNPWTGQWYALPQELIKQIGDVVYNSSIYAALPRAEKSAVNRLRAGSGSKPQCIRYLDKLPPDEVPELLTSLLCFDYEQVVGVEDTGVHVEMYDVEVFDDVHAFVCDGVIVHNSGADIIKIAMALVYKHCKKKGWLDTCRLIASMHDELVFEMHESIIEEAIAEIVPIMTSNPFIKAKRWPVPLTTDCEIGHDWTVHWDLNAMRFREVRFDGDKKVKEPKKPSIKDFPTVSEFKDAEAAYPAKKAAWEALPHSFPETLRKHFKNLGVGAPTISSFPTSSQPAPAAPPAPASATPGEPASEESSGQVLAQKETVETVEVDEAMVTEVDEALVAERTTVTMGSPFGNPFGDSTMASNAAPTPAPALNPEPPRDGSGTGIYDYTVNATLNTLTCVKLAEVIAQCKGQGTRKLRLLLPDGMVLSGWSDGDCFVNDSQFYWTARAAGL